jgi:TfoX/Sxy family transcriptional regulator of competence genes
MAYDEVLADRVRELVSARADLSERKMFGGIGFMVGGNMAVGVIGDELIVRLEPDDAEKALAEQGVREFDFTGRPMKGWIFVASERTADDTGLGEWVDAGADYAASLPAK